MLKNLLRSGKGFGRTAGTPGDDLPPPDACDLQLLKKPKKEVPEEWDDIMSYPPAAKALPADRIDGILYQNRTIILRIKETLGVSDEHFETMLMPVIRNLADFAHLLPGSEAHHHRGSGGFLRHSLEVGFYAAQFAEDVIFVLNAPPKERRNKEHAWRLATCLTGLLHDAGKPIADVEVLDDRGKSWNPLESGLYTWLRNGGRKRYYINWRHGRHKSHERFATRAFDRIVPNEVVSHLLNVDIRIMESVYDAISGLGVDHHIARISIDADQASVRRDAKIDQELKSGQSFDYGLPIHRYLFTAFRSMVNSERLKINEPGGLVWHTTEGLFVNWKALLPVLIDEVKRTSDVTVPNEPDDLADQMIQRGLAIARYPDGVSASEDDRYENFYYYYWIVTPEKLVENRDPDSLKLTLLKIDDPGRIFSEEWPVATGARIWSDAELKPQVQTPMSDQVSAGLGDQQESSVEGDAPKPAGIDPTKESLDPDTGEVKPVEPDSHPSETNETPAQPENTPSGGQGEDSEVKGGATPGGQDAPEQMDLASRAMQNRKASSQQKRDNKKSSKQNASSQEPQASDSSNQGGGQGSAAETPSQNGSESSVADVVASIDEDMDLPFGLDSSPSEGGSTEENAKADAPKQSAKDAELSVEQGSGSNDPAARPESQKSDSGVAQEQPQTDKNAAVDPAPAPAQASGPDNSQDQTGPGFAGTKTDAEKDQPTVEGKDKQEKGNKEKGPKQDNSKNQEPSSRTNRKSFELIQSGAQSKAYQGGISDSNRVSSSGAAQAEPQSYQQARDRLQSLLDTWGDAGKLIGKAVDEVIENEGRLGTKWWVVGRQNVVFRFPQSFAETGSEALKIINILKEKGVIQPDPRKPLSPTCTQDGVNVVKLNNQASLPFVRLLGLAEMSIDPFAVDPEVIKGESGDSRKLKRRTRNDGEAGSGFGQENDKESAQKESGSGNNKKENGKKVREKLVAYTGERGDYEAAAKHIIDHLETGTSQWFSGWQKHEDGVISFSKETLQLAMADLDPISSKQFQQHFRDALYAGGYKSRIKGGIWWFTPMKSKK